jgi:hypothetical protein
VNPWVRVLGVLAAVVVAALLLKVIHPLLVFALRSAASRTPTTSSR